MGAFLGKFEALCDSTGRKSRRNTYARLLDHQSWIHPQTPLMWIDKAETWLMAESLGGDELVRLITEETHTCYLGDRSKRHPWGFGCGTYPACDLRAKGYDRYMAGTAHRPVEVA